MREAASPSWRRSAAVSAHRSARPPARMLAGRTRRRARRSPQAGRSRAPRTTPSLPSPVRPSLALVGLPRSDDPALHDPLGVLAQHALGHDDQPPYPSVDQLVDDGPPVAPRLDKAAEAQAGQMGRHARLMPADVAHDLPGSLRAAQKEEEDVHACAVGQSVEKSRQDLRVVRLEPLDGSGARPGRTDGRHGTKPSYPQEPSTRIKATR